MVDFEKLSDEELVLYSSRGDGAAESCLIKRYKQRVSLYARRFYLIGGDDEDLIQEGTIGLLAAVRTYNSGKGTAFSTYAYKCIRSKLIDAISFRKYSEYVSLDESEVFDSVVAENNPEALYIENEHYVELIDSLRSGLSSYELSVLNLFLNGESYTEIAARLRKSPQSVYNAVQRIRNKLSSILHRGDTGK